MALGMEESTGAESALKTNGDGLRGASFASLLQLKAKLETLLERADEPAYSVRFETCWSGLKALQAALRGVADNESGRRELLCSLFTPAEQKKLLGELQAKFNSARGYAIGPALARLEIFYIACRHGAADMESFNADPFVRKGRETLRSKIMKLSCAEPYESAEELSECLATSAHHKDLLQSLFEKAELTKIYACLQAEHASAHSNVTSFTSYMEGVHQRLARFEEICTRGSWGFAFGVDQEDLIDERNEGTEIGKRNKAENAAIMRLKAFRSAFPALQKLDSADLRRLLNV